MADLSITAANVIAGTSAQTEAGTSGTTITAGDSVYLATDDNKFYTTNTNSAVNASVRGMALNNASANQPVDVLTEGDVNPGATVAIGTIYVVSSSSGKIRPSADMLSGNFVAVVGIGTTASNIKILPIISGVSLP